MIRIKAPGSPVNDRATTPHPQPPRPYSLGAILEQTERLQAALGRRPAANADRPADRQRRDRFVDRAQDIARHYKKTLTGATSSEQRAAIENAFARLSGERPLKHRGRSDFSEPPPHHLTWRARRDILAAFDALREHLYDNDPRPYKRKVSIIAREVLEYLLSYAGRGEGRVFRIFLTCTDLPGAHRLPVFCCP